MLLTLQQAMMAACYGAPDGYAATLPHLADGGVPADKALYIHTATVTAALTGVLAQAYPAVAARLGETEFAAAARDFLRRHPPAAGVLSAYGKGFAAALPPSQRAFAAADWAAQQAYFAADSDALTPAMLSALPPDALAGLPMTLVPSASLVDGDVDQGREWQTLRPDIAFLAPPLPLDGLSGLLIWRGPDLLVAATILPADAVGLLRALQHGTPLLEAAATLENPDLLPSLLALLLTHGLLAATTPTVTL